jgi:hypothetical protein
MPYADPERRREADRDRKRRARTLVAVSELEAELPDPPTRDDLLRVLGVLARRGHVTATRILLEEYRRDGQQPERDGGFFDELDAIRARKRGA